MSIFSQALIRVRYGTKTDRGGNQVPDLNNVSRETIEQLSVQPSYQREQLDETADRLLTGYRVLSEPGTTPDILASDKLEYRGQVFKVDGEVAYWPGLEHDDHIEFAMSTAGGA